MASSEIRPEINITAYEGSTFNRLFIWKSGPEDGTKEPVDLTGYTGICHIRTRLSSDDIVFDLTTNDGVYFEDQSVTKGGYRLIIPKEELEGICSNHRDVSFVYDLRLIDSDDNVRVQQYGTITFKPVVTRPWIS